MNKISKSPDRHSFQKEGYVKRQVEKNESVNENYLDMFDEIINQHTHKFDNPDARINNMEYDLLTTDWILEKTRGCDEYAQNLYAAMCNNDFQKLEVLPVLKGETWSCSWRSSGGIVADMQQKGDYINWYCSGIRDVDHDEEVNKEWDRRKYVPEGCVTDEIRNDLQRLGWVVVPGGDWEKFKDDIKQEFNKPKMNWELYEVWAEDDIGHQELVDTTKSLKEAQALAKLKLEDEGIEAVFIYRETEDGDLEEIERLTLY